MDKISLENLAFCYGDDIAKCAFDLIMQPVETDLSSNRSKIKEAMRLLLDNDTQTMTEKRENVVIVCSEVLAILLEIELAAEHPENQSEV